VLIEYATQPEAQAAIEGANGEKLLDQTISADYAFVRAPPNKGRQSEGGRGGRGGGIGRRGRSKSPEAGRDRDRDKDRDRDEDME
jgi:RNA-binding protein 8A